eukprot:1963573-Pyramimonas_sp.AAC.1
MGSSSGHRWGLSSCSAIGGLAERPGRRTTARCGEQAISCETATSILLSRRDFETTKKSRKESSWPGALQVPRSGSKMTAPS